MKAGIQSRAATKSGRQGCLTEKTASGSTSLGWNKILAPTDLSEPSKCAIGTAAALAQKCQAKLVLLHVVPCPNCSSFDAPPDAGKMMDEARESLDEIARMLPPDVTVEKIVRFGTREPVDQIVEEADHVRADLIVIATHGYCGLKRALLGSTAERVVRHAPCPVLVVRRPGSGRERKHTPVEPENPFSTY